jgi:hypothetical protein
MLEAGNTSEMSVCIYKTAWCNIPEGCCLHRLSQVTLISFYYTAVMLENVLSEVCLMCMEFLELTVLSSSTDCIPLNWHVYFFIFNVSGSRLNLTHNPPITIDFCSKNMIQSKLKHGVQNIWMYQMVTKLKMMKIIQEEI